METVSLKQVFSASIRRNPLNPLRFRSRRRQLRLPTRRFRFASTRSKQSDFQDFQDYAKPARLLPATEVNVCTETSVEKLSSAFDVGGSRSLFKVNIQTSNLYGSSLSDVNAGILLCLIDENGDSILQRIPASLMVDHTTKLENKAAHGMFHFQRGSSDEFVFEGPKLGRVQALWISVESGQWRFRGVNLTVISAGQPSSAEHYEDQIQYVSFSYDFQSDDILLGEGANLSMVELRPAIVTESSGINLINLLHKSLLQPTSPSSRAISNEESMKEYADLKLSLLLYDALLVFTGTSVSSYTVGKSSGVAFFIGGVTGFLYLLLLQRSIDELPALPLASASNAKRSSLEGFKTPLSTIAVAVGVCFLAAKYSFFVDDHIPFTLSAKDLLIGTVGFLACKVAVVLAAFKPMSGNPKEDK